MGPTLSSYKKRDSLPYSLQLLLLPDAFHVPSAHYYLVSQQWRQRQCNIGGDVEGIKEQLQLQGIRKRVPLLLDDNVGSMECVVSPFEVCN